MNQLSTADKKAIQLFKDGATIEDAYIQTFPIAKKWKLATVQNKAKRLFESPEALKIINLPKKTKNTKRTTKKTKPTTKAKKANKEPGFEFSEKQKSLYDLCTPFQRRIVLYMVTGNATQRKAYYAAGGTAKTPESADSSVYEILKKPKVKLFYDSLMETIVGDSIMTREEMLTRLTKMARTSISDVATFTRIHVGEDDKGKKIYQSFWDAKDSSDISEDAALSIQEVSTSATGVKLKLHDQRAAMKDLRAMEGWDAARKFEHTGPDGRPMETITTEMTPEQAGLIYKKGLKND